MKLKDVLEEGVVVDLAKVRRQKAKEAAAAEHAKGPTEPRGNRDHRKDSKFYHSQSKWHFDQSKKTRGKQRAHHKEMGANYMAAGNALDSIISKAH